MTTYHSKPTDCAIHETGWAEVPGTGVEVTKLPVIDLRHSLPDGTPMLARLTYDEALEVAATHGAGLIAPGRINDLRKPGVAVQLHPYLGTPIAETGIEHSVRHDSEVWRQLRALGWDGVQPVVGAGKHWVAGAPPGRSRLEGWDKDGPGVGVVLWQPDQVAHNRLHFDDATTTVLERTIGGRPPKSDPDPHPTLRRGSKGEAVREWQRRLNAWGVLESNPGALLLIVDGDYGRRTASSTVAFQHAHALAADGIVGPRTWAASEPIPPAPDTLPAPPPSAVGRAEPTVDDFIQARHYTATTGRTINWIVLHSMEGGTARSVARWFGGPSAPQASAHFCVGPVEVIQCVMLENVAWAAPGANAAGVQIEMEGRAMKTDWLNSPVMARTAKLVAELCPYLDIPAQRVTAEGLLRGERGITSHCAVSDAWRKSTHQDPGGPGDRRWPWGAFLEAVRGEPVRASR